MRDKTIRPIVLVLLLLVATLTATPAPQKASDDQQITHVLNRLGFGARPADIERVRKMGLRQYIEQQLHPEDLNDSRADEWSPEKLAIAGTVVTIGDNGK